MSETFALVRGLVASGEVRISEHGYDELADDGISVSEILAGVAAGTVVEDYPDYLKGNRFWCYSWTAPVELFMWSGASRKASKAQRCW